MLGPIDLSGPLNGYPQQVSAREYVSHDMAIDAGDRSLEGELYSEDEWQQTAPPLDWVITGGESGPKARLSDDAWFDRLRTDCERAKVPFFLKQRTRNGRQIPFGDWPEALKVRQYPEAA